MALRKPTKLAMLGWILLVVGLLLVGLWAAEEFVPEVDGRAASSEAWPEPGASSPR
ncbi:hypothetical protein [Streptomonospora alba]|uniref:hypothetical protein n=1 Tax=Streptomonospora alba TaxID=183763 RepID=UPI0012ECEBA6|nr:hypothetical protein [Streptomonospora alba]